MQKCIWRGLFSWWLVLILSPAFSLPYLCIELYLKKSRIVCISALKDHKKLRSRNSCTLDTYFWKVNIVAILKMISKASKTSWMATRITSNLNLVLRKINIQSYQKHIFININVVIKPNFNTHTYVCQRRMKSSMNKVGIPRIIETIRAIDLSDKFPL